MEVPSAVLSKLLCDSCENPLSRGSVYLLDNSKSRCGRCSEPVEGVRRNVQYEELAKLVAFPCQYEKQGCRKTVTFEESRDHEEACTFRPFKCLIDKSGICSWIGGRGEVLQHCQDNHPDTVVENGCQLTYCTGVSGVHNYILCAFRMLFLLQTTVCTSSRHIYYSVRLFGGRDKAAQYTFDIDMKNCSKKVSARGNVVARGSLLQCPVALGLDELLDVLGDFKDLVCTITVQSTETETKIFGALVVCWKCNEPTVKLYHDHTGWLCGKCIPSKSACVNSSKGCTSTHFSNYLHGHETYFCDYSTTCPICKINTLKVSLREHYMQAHQDITHRAGEQFSIVFTDSVQYCILRTVIGDVMCHYTLSETGLNLNMTWCAPINYNFWYQYTVKISHPKTRHAVTTAAEIPNWQPTLSKGVSLPNDKRLFVHDSKINLQIDIAAGEIRT